MCHTRCCPLVPEPGLPLRQDKGHCSGENSWATVESFPGFGQNVPLGVDRLRWTSPQGRAELHTLSGALGPSRTRPPDPEQSSP